MQDLVGVARVMLAGGEEADDIARELLGRTSSPISAIKALVDGAGISLAEAKPIMHRNLDPTTRDATERLWDELYLALRDRTDGMDGDQGRANEDPRASSSIAGASRASLDRPPPDA